MAYGAGTGSAGHGDVLGWNAAGYGHGTFLGGDEDATDAVENLALPAKRQRTDLIPCDRCGQMIGVGTVKTERCRKGVPAVEACGALLMRGTAHVAMRKMADRE